MDSLTQFLRLSILQDPCVFRAAALRGIHYQGSFAQRHSRETTWNNGNFLAVKNIGPEIDVTGLNGSVHKTWGGRKIDGRLRDVVSRLRADLVSKFRALLFRAMRANQHAVAARLAHCFHYVLIQSLADVVPLPRIGHQQRFDAFKYWILVEIVANDFGHIGVDSFVVGDSRPQRVCKGYVPGAIVVEEADSTKRGTVLENQGIKIIVVDSTIDNINPLQAERRSHVDHIVVDHKIPALDQFNAHLTCEIGMFEISGIVGAGGQ